MNVSKGDLAIIMDGYEKFYIGKTCIVLDYDPKIKLWKIHPFNRLLYHESAKFFIIKDAHLKKICSPPDLCKKAIDKIIDGILK